MIGESPDVRYRVCLIVRTSGSSAACDTNRSTEAVNDSYGWWSSRSPARITANTSTGSSSSGGSRRCGTTGTWTGALRSGRSRSTSCHRAVRSIIPATS